MIAVDNNLETHLFLGPISHIVLLGSSNIFYDIESYCNNNNIKISTITSPDQEKEIKNITTCVVENIEDGKVKEILNSKNPEETISISFGARWLFKKEHIQKIFFNSLFNVHGTRLPYDRGGGGFSWRIMRNDRIGNILIHKVDEGIDTGPILQQKEYIIPKWCALPIEIEKDYQARLLHFILHFFDLIKNKKQCFNLETQNNNLAFYNPRLSSNLHSWIDWNLSAVDLDRFITAFDDPYPGALTEWKKGPCRIKKVQMHGGEVPCHPFQSGIIFRKSAEWILCYTSCGKSLIIEDVKDLDGNNLIPQIQIGDRFFTNPQKLFESISTRVQYTPMGKK